METKANSITRVDALNLVLILLSLFLAFVIPFSLFLFSYAILGPLHYLTEINWLNDKNYFVRNKSWIWLFAITALIISLPPLSNLPIFIVNSHNIIPEKLVLLISAYSDILLLSLFLFAFGLIFLRNHKQISLYLIFSILLSKIIVSYVLGSYILIGIFLPTIIHVYVFTLLFMLLGALNSKSRTAYIGTILLLISPLIIYLIQVPSVFYFTTESDSAIQTSKNFRFINFIAEIFHSDEKGRIISLSEIGIKIQIFIAFCYTYHYLNWFAKTSVIGWRKNMSASKLKIIISFWVLSILLVIYNYEVAYLALFFLTLLHIVLEFPLNIISMKEIIFKIKNQSS